MTLELCPGGEFNVVVHAIGRAIARDEHLDLSVESSEWNYSSVSATYSDMRTCGLTRSSDCPKNLITSMAALVHGTPLFGDNLKTNWSLYTFYVNDELRPLINALQAAVDYERPIPDYVPEEVRREMQKSLSSASRSLIEDLTRWFDELEKVGQDAFILWW